MKPEDFDYVISNNICIFQKGPLSQWWGGFKGQRSEFTLTVDDIHSCLFEFTSIGLQKDQTYNCCEQWMMAAKALVCNDVESYLKILQTTNPKIQKQLGRQIEGFNPDKWDKVKEQVVYYGNFAKFTQNEDLKQFLLSFNKFTIFAEGSPWDKIWGIGLDPSDKKALDISTWEGENLLGLQLMKVRMNME